MMIQIPADVLERLEDPEYVLDDYMARSADPIGQHLFMPHTTTRGWDKRLCSYNGCGASPESAVHLG